MEQLKQYHSQKVHHNNIENLNIQHTYHNYLVYHKIGDRGHPCLTPRLIENSSKRLPLKKARALEDR